MSNENFSVFLKTLKRLDSISETSPDVLGQVFDTCLKIHDLIENSNLSSTAKEFEEAIETCIVFLEKCTHMVNELALFSFNEVIEEVETSSLKYLLLPALLGSLNLSKQSKELSKRIEFLEAAEVYFKDFLFRCKNYELSKNEVVNSYGDQVLENYDYSDENSFSTLNIADLAAQRENKIRIYKLKKELKTRENELNPALNRTDAEECIREYYIVMIERWILIAIEELRNIKSEKSVVDCMVKERQENSNDLAVKPKKTKPLKPIIITKNEIQKKVFGLGYPSIPVMTVDDFYQQRFEKMVEEHKNSSKKSMQAAAMKGEPLNKDDEDIRKEELLEHDDPVELQQARDWDDWKDDNPRGSGNRYNKG